MSTGLVDTTTAAHAPVGCAAYAGYGNGAWPSAAPLKARFPDVPVLTIDVANEGLGEVLDVERGDATPADVPAWVTGRRAAGVDPWVYVAESNLAAAKQACQAAGVAEPWWWVAWWTPPPGTELQAGWAAIQFRHDVEPGYDVSVMSPQAPLPRASAPTPGPAPEPSPSTGGTVNVPTIQSGSTGQPVRALQAILNGTANQNLTVDGTFGPATEAAVRGYQAFVKLTVDGIVGPATWTALLTA